MIIPDLCLTALNESLIPYLTQPNKGRSQSSCTQTRHLPRTVDSLSTLFISTQLHWVNPVKKKKKKKKRIWLMFCCVQTVWQMIFFHFVACCRCHPSCRKCFGVLALLAVIDYPLNIKDGCTSMKMFARFCELKHSRTLSSFGNALQILHTHARPLYLRFMHCIHSQSASFCFLICVEWLSLYWCYGKRQERRWNLLSAFSAVLQMG